MAVRRFSTGRLQAIEDFSFYCSKFVLTCSMHAQSSTNISACQFLYHINVCIKSKQKIFVRYPLTQVLPLREELSWSILIDYACLLRSVSGARFSTLIMSECDTHHRRSVAVLCTLHKVRFNPMYPLDGALSLSYVLYLCRITILTSTSVYLYASSLQNVEVPQDIILRAY